jgi:hypothetical protein
MFINKAKTTSGLHLEDDSEGLFHSIATITNRYKDVVSREHIGF